MSLPLLALGGFGVVAAPVVALLAHWWWDERRAGSTSPPDRGDPETLVADLASAGQTPTMHLERLYLPPTDGDINWKQLDQDQLDLAHRMERAVRVPQQREPS